MLSAGIAPGNAGSFIGNVVSGAVTNAVVQGIAVATGLQDKFDWAGVAAAGIAHGVNTSVSAKGLFGIKPTAGSFGSRALSGAASAIASAATRSAISGDSFGDSLRMQLPSLIGQLAGTALGEQFDGRSGGEAGSQPARKSGGVLGAIEDALSLPGRVANTIGNLVADAVAGDGSPKSGNKETGQSSPANAKDGSQGSGNSSSGSDSPDALSGDIVVTAQRREAVYRLGIDSQFLIRAGWSEGQDTPFTPNGQSFGKTIFDTLTSPLDDARDNARRALDRLKRQGVEVGVEGTAYVLTTAAINSPFTTDLAAQLLTEWRDGGDGARHFYGYDSDATRELFLGYSGDYYRNITSLGISQLASANNGIIRDGSRLASIKNIPDFSGSDGAYGIRDGINVGDVIGTFTYGVSAESRGGYMYFTGKNAMSLGSFAVENRLQHGQVSNPTRGAFSNTYQTFQWRVPIPRNMMAH